jgi:hypothetical protein
LEHRADVVTNLDLAVPLDLLCGQAAVTDELAALSQRQQPEAKAMLAVKPPVPHDPGERLVAAFRVRIEAHNLGITE